MKHRKRLAAALFAGALVSVVVYWQSRSDHRNEDLLARHKEAVILTYLPAPLTANPWHRYRCPASPSGPGGGFMGTEGIVPDRDPKTGKPMVGTGTYPWNPGPVTIDSGDNSVLETIRRFVGLRSAWKVVQNVPCRVVPYGSVGTVYSRPLKNRITFRYKQHAQGGFFHPDGVEELHTGTVDRPTGATEVIIWVQNEGVDWPESTSLDLARLPQ